MAVFHSRFETPDADSFHSFFVKTHSERVDDLNTFGTSVDADNHRERDNPLLLHLAGLIGVLGFRLVDQSRWSHAAAGQKRSDTRAAARTWTSAGPAPAAVAIALAGADAAHAHAAGERYQCREWIALRLAVRHIQVRRPDERVLNREPGYCRRDLWRRELLAGEPRRRATRSSSLVGGSAPATVGRVNVGRSVQLDLSDGAGRIDVRLAAHHDQTRAEQKKKACMQSDRGRYVSATKWIQSVSPPQKCRHEFKVAGGRLRIAGERAGSRRNLSAGCLPLQLNQKPAPELRTWHAGQILCNPQQIDCL